MAKGQYLLIVCALVCLAQTSTAWWWRRTVCPQQRQCSLPCKSGYVTRFDRNGCKTKLCKCIDSCENYYCPANRRCVKKQYCSSWGGCAVFPRCFAVQHVLPTRTTTATSTTATTTTTTTTVAPTPRIIQASRCLDGQPELAGSFCGRGPGSQRCPGAYTCVIDPLDRFAVCCPLPVPALPVNTTTTTTTAAAQSSRCSDTQPELENWNCGRGGEPCPGTHKCLIDPADRFAVCCPIPVPNDEPQLRDDSELPMCEQPPKTGFCKAHIPRWHFDSNTGKCAEFVYGGCNANANNFLTQKACERACGAPGVSYCTLPSETGRCRAAFFRYFYNTSTNQCEDFIFGGCEGNGNNFHSLSQCQRYCP